MNDGVFFENDTWCIKINEQVMQYFGNNEQAARSMWNSFLDFENE